MGHYSFKCAQDSFNSWTVQEVFSGIGDYVPMISCPKDCTFFQDREEAEREQKRQAEEEAREHRQREKAEKKRKQKEQNVAKWKARLRILGELGNSFLDSFSEKVQVVIVGLSAVVMIWLFAVLVTLHLQFLPRTRPVDDRPRQEAPYVGCPTARCRNAYLGVETRTSPVLRQKASESQTPSI